MAPTLEMKKIAKKLNKVSNTIGKRLSKDIKRAKEYAQCAAIRKPASYKSIKSLLMQARRDSKSRIVKSVLVCDECLTVTFEVEVEKIRKLLKQASKEAQEYARKVVKCAGVNRKSGQGSGGSRTDSALDKAVKDVEKIVASCTVCPHK